MDSVGFLPLEWYNEEEQKARIHTAGACPGDYGLARYKRHGRVLWLCSCCNLVGDQRLNDAEGISEVPRPS